MTRVQVSKHVLVNVRRRSLCDNCLEVGCVDPRNHRVIHCEGHVAPFFVFKKCPRCGKVYEIFSDIASLDYDICPECNHAERHG
ncbi:MAG TPA: hypothetical protein VMS79_03345 [Methanomassiliicoccales archaeon]|nr:hypothetical protein [Methanomassiliicoccales archaeon]